MRWIRRKKKPQAGRSGECCVCGTAGLTGAEWWTLTTVPPDVPGEPTFGGGSVMQTDYCATHRPHLTHHG